MSCQDLGEDEARYLCCAGDYAGENHGWICGVESSSKRQSDIVLNYKIVDECVRLYLPK